MQKNLLVEAAMDVWAANRSNLSAVGRQTLVEALAGIHGGQSQAIDRLVTRLTAAGISQQTAETAAENLAQRLGSLQNADAAALRAALHAELGEANVSDALVRTVREWVFPVRTPAQQAAAGAAQGHPVLQCEQCATSIRTRLQAAGHHGEIIEIRGVGGGDFIASGSHDNWQTTITQNGRHVGVNVGGIVFDNIHPNGLPLAEWLQDFDAIGGIIIHSRTPF